MMAKLLSVMALLYVILRSQISMGIWAIKRSLSTTKLTIFPKKLAFVSDNPYFQLKINIYMDYFTFFLLH